MSLKIADTGTPPESAAVMRVGLPDVAVMQAIDQLRNRETRG